MRRPVVARRRGPTGRRGELSARAGRHAAGRTRDVLVYE